MVNMRKIEWQIKTWLSFFMVVLFLSGVTAIPVVTELAFLKEHVDPHSSMGTFISSIENGVTKTAKDFPVIFYGFDWLAFAHFILAFLFLGPIQDPVKNKWVIQFGMIACLLIVPFAMVAGYFRGIPIGWRLIDCSFGIIGIVPLAICYRKIKMLEFLIKKTS